MDGYRQTLLGRALADALQELENEQRADGPSVADLDVDGDHLFVLFDEAIRAELRDLRNRSHKNQVRRFTHEKLNLSGQIVAFNRYMNDWSVQACIKASGIKLDHSVADLHLPKQGRLLSHEQEANVRLKLRQQI